MAYNFTFGYQYNQYLTPFKAYDLAFNHGRNNDFESCIVQDAQYSYLYARDIIKDRWLEAESVIMQDVYYAHLYARDIIKGRWQEAEPTIMKSPSCLLRYIEDVIQCRWLEAEHLILAYGATYAYSYARFIIKGRWKEAEPVIMQDALCAYAYSKDIIQRPWYEAEENISKSCYRHLYVQVFYGVDEPYLAKHEVQPSIWKKHNIQGCFAPQRWFTIQSVLDMMV